MDILQHSIESIGAVLARAKAGLHPNAGRRRNPVNDLADLLFKSLVAGPDNAVISPSCLYQTLALLSRITSGETQRQLLAAVGMPEESRPILNSIMHPACNKMKSGFKFDTGTSVWLNWSHKPQKNYRLGRPFRMKDVKCMHMGSPGAERSMSTWLSEHTGGIFSKAPEHCPLTGVVAIGAVYLKDTWQSQFASVQHCDFRLDDGNITHASYMSNLSNRTYLARGGSMTVSCQLSAGCKMILSLPPEGTTLKTYAESGEAWLNIRSHSRGRHTDHSAECLLLVPEFTLESNGTDLEAILKSIGITDLLQDPDFSAVLAIPVTEASMAQSTRLRVDHNGLEGVSYVAYCGRTGGPPPEPKAPFRIVFDRPFAVCVFTPEGIPLFAGLVDNPER